MRIPRRILAQGALCLVLGFITTIAVAWCFAFADIRGPGRDAVHAVGRGRLAYPSPFLSDAPNAIYVMCYQRAGAAVYYASMNGPDYQPPLGIRLSDPSLKHEERIHAFFPAWATDVVVPWLNDPSLRPRGDDGDFRSVEMSGWPLLCLYSREFRRPNFTKAIEGRIALPPSYAREIGDYGFLFGPTPVTLPCLAHIPALAANTAFYTLAWLLLVTLLSTTVRRARSFLRRRRNLCPRCAYSLLNLPPNSPCPECGHASTPQL